MPVSNEPGQPNQAPPMPEPVQPVVEPVQPIPQQPNPIPEAPTPVNQDAADVFGQDVGGNGSQQQAEVINSQVNQVNNNPQPAPASLDNAYVTTGRVEQNEVKYGRTEEEIKEQQKPRKSNSSTVFVIIVIIVLLVFIFFMPQISELITKAVGYIKK